MMRCEGALADCNAALALHAAQTEGGASGGAPAVALYKLYWRCAGRMNLLTG